MIFNPGALEMCPVVCFALVPPCDFFHYRKAETYDQVNNDKGTCHVFHFADALMKFKNNLNRFKKPTFKGNKYL